MTAPKSLEGLPGIDWGSPYVYETPDEDPELIKHLKDTNKNGHTDDAVVSKIDKSVKDVQTTLKDKFLDASHVDFSDAPVRLGKSGYAVGSDLIIGEETQSQRLNRIVKELDEMSTQAAGEKADASVPDILQEISKIRSHVGTLINSQLSVKLSHGPAASTKTVSEIRRAVTTPSTGKESSSDSSIYRLYHHPDSDKYYQLAKAAELESRLGRLENVLGTAKTSTASSFVMSLIQRDSQKEGLLEQLTRMESKLSLLDPAKLDLIDARLASLLTKLQNISNTTQVGQGSGDGGAAQMDMAKTQKLIQLHELLTSNSEQLQTLPKVIDRLTALSDLHTQAVQMVDAVSFIEKSQAQLDVQLNTCQQLLEGVSKSLEQNSNDIAAYCRRVEESGSVKRKP